MRRLTSLLVISSMLAACGGESTSKSSSSSSQTNQSSSSVASNASSSIVSSSMTSSSSLPASSSSVSSSLMSSSSSLAGSSSSSAQASCEDDVAAGQALYQTSCAACHGTPTAGMASWSKDPASAVIDLFDAAGDGYRNFSGGAMMLPLPEFLAEYMPPFGGTVTIDQANSITAYMVDAVELRGGWCAGEAWPPADEAGSSSSASSVASSASSSISSSSSVASSSASSSVASSASSSAGEQPFVIYAVNVGGDDFASADGQMYEADNYVSAAEGGVSATTNAIAGTEDDALFQSQRYGVFIYELPVIEGHYNVTLKLAEQYAETNGMRIMSATAEGVDIVTNFDLFATAGFETAYEISKNNIEVTDGSLTIRFTATENYATLSGLLVTTVDGDIGVPQPPAAACSEAGITICTDFEVVDVGGIPAGFDGIGRNAQVVADGEARSGTKSMKFIGASYGEGYLKKSNVSGKHWGRVFYKIKTPTPTANSHSVLHSTFVALKAENYEARVVDTVQANGDRSLQYLYNVQIDGAGEGGKSTAYNWRFENEWVCAEWHVDNTTQTYEFFLDGARIDQISGPVVYPSSNSIPATYQWIGFGLRVYQANTGLEGWMDDIAVGPERIGCE